MPYIVPELRESVCPFVEDDAMTAGELNYQITCLVSDYIVRKGKSYGAINEVMGALECAKLELYRRIAAPYEDEKIVQNGDVYPIELRSLPYE